jgi:hypothetical protein
MGARRKRPEEDHILTTQTKALENKRAQRLHCEEPSIHDHLSMTGTLLIRHVRERLKCKHVNGKHTHVWTHAEQPTRKRTRSCATVHDDRILKPPNATKKRLTHFRIRKRE